MNKQYSSGIKIVGAMWSGGGSVALSKGHAQNFITGTTKCLDMIQNTKTGRQLITEINATGHEVAIYRAPTLNDGNYQAGDSGTPGVDMVFGLDARYPDGTTVFGDIIASAAQDTRQRTKLQKLFRIGKARPKFMNRDGIARLLGVSTSDLKKMEEGKKAIPPLVADRVRTYFYDFLVPGTGESCRVIFNHQRDNLSDDHKKYLPSSHTWEHRPPAIGLAHELIHAWRVMSGMVLFPYGWEEEAMTVGLPPFSNMTLTENRVRVDWGNLAIRPDYRYIENESELLRGQKTDRGQNQIWQGSDRSLHANQALAQTAASRRAAMGYDDDDFDDSDWD